MARLNAEMEQQKNSFNDMKRELAAIDGQE